MKKIFFSLAIIVSLFSGSFVFADESKTQSMSEVSSKENPSIKIEFENFDQDGEDFKNIKGEFNGESLVLNKEDLGALGGIFALGFGALLLVLLFAIACFVFWIMMLVHAVSKPIKSKPLWIIVILLFGIIGAVVYYFAVKRSFKKEPLVEVVSTETQN